MSIMRRRSGLRLASDIGTEHGSTGRSDYRIIIINLDDAKTDKVFEITGDNLEVLGLTGEATIRLDNIGNDLISLNETKKILTNFGRFFLTNTAQAGKILKIAVGKDFSIESNQTGDQSVIEGDYQAYEDTNFVTGDSPVTHDVNADLGRNATAGYIVNDGAGNFTVAFSKDGSTFGDEVTLQSGDVFDFAETKLIIDQIRVTWVADSSYRIVVS